MYDGETIVTSGQVALACSYDFSCGARFVRSIRNGSLLRQSFIVFIQGAWPLGRGYADCESLARIALQSSSTRQVCLSALLPSQTMHLVAVVLVFILGPMLVTAAKNVPSYGEPILRQFGPSEPPFDLSDFGEAKQKKLAADWRVERAKTVHPPLLRIIFPLQIPLTRHITNTHLANHQG